MARRINRIDSCFKELKKDKKKALIVFITAGYPDLKTTERLVLGLEMAGADIIELGVPFSDPMADGPVIQESSFEALKKNTRLVDILALARRLRQRTGIPMLLMTYYNPVFAFGERRFIKAALNSGIDGVIIPDLPPEEGRDFIRLAESRGLHNICFISLTTSPKRMKMLLKKAKGFIYYISLTGVTGARSSLSKGLRENVKRIKRHTRVPVCVGFGISGGRQAREVNRFSDGVIVGSAVVNKIRDNIRSPYLAKRVASFVRSLK